MAKVDETFSRRLRRLGDAQGVKSTGPRERRATPRKSRLDIRKTGLDRDPSPKAKFEQNFKKLRNVVSAQSRDAANPGRRQSFPSRVAAATGQVPAKGRRVVQRAAGGISKALRISPVALGAAALLQPRKLGDATRGTPMNSPAEVRRINAEKRRRKARSIPRSMRRGLR